MKNFIVDLFKDPLSILRKDYINAACFFIPICATCLVLTIIFYLKSYSNLVLIFGSISIIGGILFIFCIWSNLKDVQEKEKARLKRRQLLNKV
jgi:hypothetical protein